MLADRYWKLVGKDRLVLIRASHHKFAHPTSTSAEVKKIEAEVGEIEIEIKIFCQCNISTFMVYDFSITH
jgi:hypothetical protein